MLLSPVRHSTAAYLSARRSQQLATEQEILAVEQSILAVEQSLRDRAFSPDEPLERLFMRSHLGRRRREPSLWNLFQKLWNFEVPRQDDESVESYRERVRVAFYEATNGMTRQEKYNFKTALIRWDRRHGA